jgi:hypothetical protein
MRMKSRLEAAEGLAAAHFRVDPSLRRVHLIEPMCDRDPSDPMRLLEVVEGTLERGIEPVGFTADPAHGVDCPSVIVEVSPAEFESFRSGTVSFEGRDWTIGRELCAL